MRPSSAHRWVGSGCTESARHTDGRTSRAAEEGTRLHDLAARVLDKEDSFGLGDLSEDDAAIVQPYVATLEGASPLYVELHRHRDVGPYRLQGTPDAVDVGREYLTVTDLKTGWGIVSAEENWQLLCYAWMWEPAVPWIQKFRLRIVQPRPWHRDGPVREWTLTRAQLEEYGKRISAAVTGVHVSPQYAAGPGCKYCPRAATCPELRQTSLTDVDHYADGSADLPDDAIAGELAALRAAAKRIELRADALEEHAIAKIKRGANIRGLATYQEMGRLNWDVPDDKALDLIETFTGRDLTKKSAPTPTQALKAGIPGDIIEHLASRKPGKLKLTTNPQQQAQKAFGPK